MLDTASDRIEVVAADSLVAGRSLAVPQEALGNPGAHHHAAKDIATAAHFPAEEHCLAAVLPDHRDREHIAEEDCQPRLARRCCRRSPAAVGPGRSAHRRDCRPSNDC